MADLFGDVLPSLLQTKKYSFGDVVEEREYNPFIVNKALSVHIDCLYYVNEMNHNHILDKKLHYDFYYHGLKSFKRSYQKWFKADKIKSLELVKEYYGYSNHKAKQALALLTKEQLKYIEDKLDKGGKSK